MAAWFPESSKILLDTSLPPPKRTFPQFHETVHSILPWHKGFFLGDTAQTLSPEYQEALELEANYGASELWFCGPEFRKRSLDFALEWKSIPELRDMFGTTLTTTLWKMVVSQKSPALGVVSIPAWKAEAGAERCKYVIKSPEVMTRFSKVDRRMLLAQIESNIVQRRGGPLGTYEVVLTDDNGDLHSFQAETFFNRHELLTLFVYKKKVSILV